MIQKSETTEINSFNPINKHTNSQINIANMIKFCSCSVSAVVIKANRE